jgi:hypothetical protein
MPEGQVVRPRVEHCHQESHRIKRQVHCRHLPLFVAPARLCQSDVYDRKGMCLAVNNFPDGSYQRHFMVDVNVGITNLAIFASAY